MRPRVSRACAAFTLLELVVAIVGLSFTAAYAISFYFRAPDVTLENAAILLAQDLRVAQNRAAYLGEPGILELDVAGYRLVDERGRVVLHPRTQLPFVRTWSADAVFEGVELAGADFAGDTRLEFDGLGAALEGGHVTLAYGGDQRTLLISRGSGRVSIPDSTSGWLDPTR
ncbi:MAG: type II secretion system protein [Planctomycetota bacterium]